MSIKETKQNTAIWLVTNDQRLEDNPILEAISNEYDFLIPIFCFQSHLRHQTEYGFPRISDIRIQSLTESLLDLKEQLQKLQSSLILINSNEIEELSRLISRYQVSTLFIQYSPATEEQARVNKLKALLPCEIIELESGYLFHHSELPFKIQDLPKRFTDFRILIEKATPKCSPIPHLSILPPLPKNFNARWDNIPYKTQQVNPKSAIPFLAGATSAQSRLQDYFWNTNLISTYKQSRNGLIGHEYSSKFSVFLALGNISARTINFELKRYEKERVSNESTYWLWFELLWREFFYLVMQQYGSRCFSQYGLKDSGKIGSLELTTFQKWKNGNTGNSFIDANMKELLQTGFMSNRGRQNVASYLIHDLGLDWRMGAAWFEHQLVDYDVCSNTCNWLYVAGLGNDPRPNRYFNIEKQAAQYDPRGEYQALWDSTT